MHGRRQLLICTAGELPESWGRVGQLPALALLAVQNNRLGGTIPAEWSRRAAFGSQPITILIKPGNDRLCGKVPPGVAALDANSSSSFSVQPLLVWSDGGAGGAPRAGSGEVGRGDGGGEGTPTIGVLVSGSVAQVQLPSC